MGRTAADQVAEMMIDAGIKRVYGVVGDSINPIVDTIRRNDGIETRFSASRKRP